MESILFLTVRVKIERSCCSLSQMQAALLLTGLLGHQALWCGWGGSEHFNWVFLLMRNRQEQNEEHKSGCTMTQTKINSALVECLQF